MKVRVPWAFLLVVGCAQGSEGRFVPLPEDEGERILFLAQFDPSGRMQVYNPRDLASGPVEIPLGESTIYHLSVLEAQARAHDRLIEGADLHLTTLHRSGSCAPSCNGTCIEDGVVRFPVPAGALIRRLEETTFVPASEDEKAELRDRLEMWVARGQHDCSWGASLLVEPFAATLDLFGENIGRILVLDEERLIAASPSHVALVTRGETLDPIYVCRSEDLVEPLILGVSARTISESSVRLWVVSGGLRGTDRDRGGVNELLIDEAGCRVVRTVHETSQLHAVASVEGGGFVAVGSRGRVVTSTDGLSIRDQSLGDAHEFIHVNFDPVLETFFVGAGLGLIGEGDLLSRPPSLSLSYVTHPSIGIIDSSVASSAFVDRASGHEVWARTYGQGVYRRMGPGDWRGVDIDAPPGLLGCAQGTDTCGRLILSRDIEFLGFDAKGDMFVATSNCSTFFVSSPNLPCTSYLPFPGVPLTEDEEVRAIRPVGDGYVFAKGRELWLLRAPSD